MYDVIQITTPKDGFMEQFSLDSIIGTTSFNEYMDAYYTEAVFKDGKTKLEKILEIFTKLKEKLEGEIASQDKESNIKDGKKFDPKKFWKDPLWKDLEDAISKTFGFRVVDIEPYQEKWSSTAKAFESRELNAFIYRTDRYPCEGLVTDEGFYDKSHSLYFQMGISLGLIKALDPREIVAVMLHELGHSIDPALVDIKYVEANILAKYLTDRKNAINKIEQKVMREDKRMNKFKFFGMSLAASVRSSLFGIFTSKDKAAKKNLEKLKKILAADDKIFRRQEFSEAYADNFARMYGYGAPLMGGLQKIDKHYDDLYSSRIKREKARQQLILAVTVDSLKDVHKTDIHRLHALEREYKADIDDPNTPAVVKKQLQNDLDELMKVYDAYTKNFTEFQSQVNKLIYEEISKLDEVTPKTESANPLKSRGKFAGDKFDKSSIKKLRDENVQKLFGFGKKDDKPEKKEDPAIKEFCVGLLSEIRERTKRKSILLSPGNEVKSDDDMNRRLETKIGGNPYWPVDEEYPIYQGRPMICLAQLNLSQLPKLEGYPTEGLLQFFVDSDEIYDTTDGIKVVYHKSPSVENALKDIPVSTFDSGDRVESIQNAYFPTASLVDDYVNANEECFGDFYDELTAAVAKKLEKSWQKYKDVDDPIIKNTISRAIWDTLGSTWGCRMGGHPSYTQFEPSEVNEDTIMLLQLDSESGMMWGDCGIAHFFCSKEVLSSLDFEGKVYFTWDCC